jgi:F0F1-type ATP synthase membrane subunit b/b'
MLDIDITTVIFQIINFLVLVVVLYYLLFRKIIQRAEVRKQELEKIRSDMLDDLKEAERLKMDLELEIGNIDTRIEEAFDKAKNELEEIRNKVLDEVKEESDQILKQSRESVRMSREQSIEDFRSDIITNSINLSRNLLKKISTDEMHNLFIKDINERVLEMGKKEMSRIETIRKSLKDREPILFIQTAKPLSKEQQAGIIRTFSALADQNVKLDIKQDQNLICGIRIRLSDYIIDNTLSSKIEEIGDEAAREWEKISSGMIS